MLQSVADPDLELRWGGRFFRDVETKLICPAGFSSFCVFSFFFLVDWLIEHIYTG